jgi:hypothetical protein
LIGALLLAIVDIGARAILIGFGFVANPTG